MAFVENMAGHFEVCDYCILVAQWVVLMSRFVLKQGSTVLIYGSTVLLYRAVTGWDRALVCSCLPSQLVV